jgi:hypothetical protein
MAKKLTPDEAFENAVRATLRHTQSRRPPGQAPMTQEDQERLVGAMLALLHAAPDEPPRRRRKASGKSARRRKG